MKKLIALYGKSGAGKNTCAKLIGEEYKKRNIPYHLIIHYTTRPKRENEVDGVDYYFLSQEEFLEKVDCGEMFEWTNFNGWYYGTSYSSLKDNCINIGIFNTRVKFKNFNDIVIWHCYVSTNPKERLLRMLNREENPNVQEILRRFTADEKDFKDWLSSNTLSLLSIIGDTMDEMMRDIKCLVRIV